MPPTRVEWIIVDVTVVEACHHQRDSDIANAQAAGTLAQIIILAAPTNHSFVISVQRVQNSRWVNTRIVGTIEQAKYPVVSTLVVGKKRFPRCTCHNRLSGTRCKTADIEASNVIRREIEYPKEGADTSDRHRQAGRTGLRRGGFPH